MKRAAVLLLLVLMILLMVPPLEAGAMGPCPACLRDGGAWGMCVAILALLALLAPRGRGVALTSQRRVLLAVSGTPIEHPPQGC